MITRNRESRVPHRRRPPVSNEPLHVTVHLIDRLPNLRNAREHRLIVAAIRKCQERFGCRVFGYCVLFNHVHLLVEAVSESQLAQFMKGLEVRIARGLNKLWQRKGSIFRERYYGRVLKTLKDIHRAVRYVIQNGRKHGVPMAKDQPDPCSSGPWYEYWKGRGGLPFRTDDCPVAKPRTMYVEMACSRFPIGLDEVPMKRENWVDEEYLEVVLRM